MIGIALLLDFLGMCAASQAIKAKNILGWPLMLLTIGAFLVILLFVIDAAVQSFLWIYF